MKKQFCAAALCAVLLLSLAAPALAGDGDFGFYDLGMAESVVLTPVTASGEAVEAVGTFYPGSSALRVTLGGTEEGAFYLLTVSSSGEIVYADQREGGGELTFSVSFALPEVRTDYLLELGSSAAGFEIIAVPFRYTPAGEAIPGNGPAPEPEPDPLPTSVFSDVDKETWYAEGVHWASVNGVMNGVGGGLFDPNGSISRAMLVTMLWRLEQEPETEYDMSFDDVPEDAWYTGAVRWAAANGIVDGYSPERFGPNDSVSREQLATILWRYARNKGAETALESSANLKTYMDAERISPWADEGMRWAVSRGLITGVDNERLSPETDATRAQVATILMRCCGNPFW